MNALQHLLTRIVLLMSPNWNRDCSPPPRRGIGRRIVLTLALIGLFNVHPATGHDSMSPLGLILEYQHKPTELRGYINIPQPLLEILLERSIPFDQVPDHATQKRLFTEIRKLFIERNPVLVDQIRVQPVVLELLMDLTAEHLDPDNPEPNHEKVRLALGNWPGVMVTLSYPLKSAPKQIAFRWELDQVYQRWKNDPRARGKEEEVEAYLYSGDEETLFEFTRQEPEFIWHSTHDPLPPPQLVPSQPTDAHISIPVVSTLLLTLGFGLAFFWRRQKIWAFACLGLGIVGAALATPLAPISLTLPWSQISPPPEKEALRIFEVLHGNVYRAFDYSTEDEIYDTLAQSVDGPLLDWTYNEIFQSLVLREAGGAISTVSKVAIQSAEILTTLDESSTLEPGAFGVRCSWRVTGKVTHWGHSHTRKNAYQAIYTLARRANAWKIVHTEILEQQRILEPPP